MRSIVDVDVVDGGLVIHHTLKINKYIRFRHHCSDAAAGSGQVVVLILVLWCTISSIRCTVPTIGWGGVFAGVRAL